MIALNILLGIAAVILFLYVVGNTSATNEQHTNITIAFVSVLLFIVAVNTIM